MFNLRKLRSWAACLLRVAAPTAKAGPPDAALLDQVKQLQRRKARTRRQQPR